MKSHYSKLVIAVFGSACLLSFPTKAVAKPVQWLGSLGGNDHYYDVIRSTNSFTWDEAQLDAASRGAHLATLTSQEEQNFVYDNLVNNPLHWNGRFGPWIGLRQTTFDTEPAGGWEWVTGELFDYENWDIGEPNDFDNDENYAQFYNGGWITPSPTWNDNQIGIGLTYVIEYELPTAVTMAETRNVPLGMLLTVEGVVTTKTDLVASPRRSSIYVQDATGGITVFGPLEQMNQLFDTINEGDSVSLSGIAKSFNGLLEFDTGLGQFTATVLGSPGVPTSQQVSTDDFRGVTGTAEALESTLVTLPNVVFQVPPGDTNFTGAANYLVLAGSTQDRATIRVPTEELDLVGTPVPPGPVSITGIFSQFDNTDPAPGVHTSGYQLQIRSLADIEYGADFDSNKDVDGADLETWEAAFGSNALADADGDGDSDGADFLAWQLQFGLNSSTPLPALAVPEPSAALLLVCSACSVLLVGSRFARPRCLANTSVI